MSKNPNPVSIQKQNLDKVDRSCWFSLPWYSDDIHVLENLIDSNALVILANNPTTIPIFERNLDKFNSNVWANLAGNPKAIHIIKENLDKLDTQA